MKLGIINLSEKVENVNKNNKSCYQKKEVSETYTLVITPKYTTGNKNKPHSSDDSQVLSLFMETA